MYYTMHRVGCLSENKLILISYVLNSSVWMENGGQHNVPRYLCSPVPMFPEPMFPGTYVPRFTANFACVRVRMCVHLGEGSPTCMCACARVYIQTVPASDVQTC